MQMENLILDIEKNSNIKSLQIALNFFLDENNIDRFKDFEIFMNRVLFSRKKRDIIIKFKEKDQEIIDKILKIFEDYSKKEYIFEGFSDYFQESLQNIEESSEIFKRNFLVSLFMDFLSDNNLQQILKETFELKSGEILEIRLSKFLKLPLIISNFSQNISRKFDSELYYEKLIKFLQKQKEFQKNCSLVLHFLNKMTFNGLIGLIRIYFF